LQNSASLNKQTGCKRPDIGILIRLFMYHLDDGNTIAS
jgi:hypothetical protein